MKIEKNIPIPEARKSETPHRQMEVGDSIVLTGPYVKRQYNTIRKYGWRTGKKFCFRSQGKDARVWRIE